MKTLPAIREFVQQGGTLMALGGEVDKVIRHFDLPIKVGTHVKVDDVEDESGDGGERATTRDEYYVPGSLLAIEVDTAHDIARGASKDQIERALPCDLVGWRVLTRARPW